MSRDPLPSQVWYGLSHQNKSLYKYGWKFLTLIEYSNRTSINIDVVNHIAIVKYSKHIQRAWNCTSRKFAVKQTPSKNGFISMGHKKDERTRSKAFNNWTQRVYQNPTTWSAFHCNHGNQIISTRKHKWKNDCRSNERVEICRNVTESWERQYLKRHF